MHDFLLEKLHELVRTPGLRQALWLVAAAAGLLAVLLAALRLIRFFKRPQQVSLLESSLVFDVTGIRWPDDQSLAARLSVYHMPAHIGLVVIAPLGRDAHSPTLAEVSSLLDQIVPGLAEVVAHDQPTVRVWPRQLSARGFSHSLARHVQLPGEHGRGSPWCLVTGRASLEDKPFGIGMALSTSTPNSLTLIVLESDHQWLDVLRIKGSSLE
ncbi:MAG: hypothetical protein HY000_11395 [Planctomycetes bacterium]|nr:hypothetical protein [Planctomycetota bacterium]